MKWICTSCKGKCIIETDYKGARKPNKCPWGEEGEEPNYIDLESYNAQCAEWNIPMQQAHMSDDRRYRTLP